MHTTKPNKRTRLIEAADTLVYQQGFKQTTLADIAAQSKVPLGNVYYYFKTKDDIGHALIEHRQHYFRCVMDKWDALPDPRERILAFIQSASELRDTVAQSGCPIGSLCQELHKDGGSLADEAAGIFSSLLEWLENQFRLLGTGKEASAHALHLVAAMQGAALLTHAFHDPKLMSREAARLMAWVKVL